MPSVLQGIGLFPGNWFVQKPGRSSQQRGGNTRPVTLLVISGDKAEKRWDLLCLEVYENVSSSSSTVSRRLLSIPLSPMVSFQWPSYELWAWGTLCPRKLSFTIVGSDKSNWKAYFMSNTIHSTSAKKKAIRECHIVIAKVIRRMFTNSRLKKHIIHVEEDDEN